MGKRDEEVHIFLLQLALLGENNIFERKLLVLLDEAT